MRIVHCFPFFSIKFAGGTSDLMYKIVKAQSKAGLKPIVLSGDYKFDGELAKTLQGVEFMISKSYLDKFGFSIMPGLLFSLIKNIKNIDVVHMHAYRTFQNFIVYLVCKLSKTPYIIDAHGAVPYHVNKKFLKRVFDFVIGYRMLKDATILVAETEVGQKEYTDLLDKLSRKNIAILSPPFDTDEFLILPEKTMFRKKFGIPLEKKVIMFLGRIHYIKGNDFLIRGFAEALKKRTDLHLVLVGSDDGHMEECKDIVRFLGIEENVIFTGFLAGKEKNSALVDADIVVQLSRFEQGAWAPLEGVLCKTPIIVTSNTGTGEDVKRIKAGYLVDFDDDEGLAETILSVFNNYDEAMSLTLEARTHIIDNLSMNARIHEYTELYKLE